MKNTLNYTTLFIFLMISFTISSCGAVEGIFKTGMGVGAFVVIAIIAVIVFIVIRMWRGKKG